jgi:outer membrane murein-binding lipoprotein Lpp
LNQQRIFVAQENFLFVVAAVASVVMFAGGCAVTQKKAHIPWNTAVLVRPNPPVQVGVGDPDDDAPGLDLQIPEPAPLAVARTVPARPRVLTPPANPAGAVEKPEMPQIVPELSPQQSSSFQRETEQNLSVAERNLAAALGRQLNATQTDLVSKIRSFMSDARAAGRTGDWARARDLSKKAQVLSDELAASL